MSGPSTGFSGIFLRQTRRADVARDVCSVNANARAFQAADPASPSVIATRSRQHPRVPSGANRPFHRPMISGAPRPSHDPTIGQTAPAIRPVPRHSEAARFNASIFPDSRADKVTPLPIETPSGPPGSVKVVDFTLLGQRLQAIRSGPLDPFNHAISLVVLCEDQKELDRYWDGLLEGGTTEACGWLRDKYGVSWQIVPAAMDRLMDDADPERFKRVASAMMKMIKLEIATLEAGFRRKVNTRLPGTLRIWTSCSGGGLSTTGGIAFSSKGCFAEVLREVERGCRWIAFTV